MRDIPCPPQNATVSLVWPNGNTTPVATRIVTMSFAVGAQEGDCDVVVFDVAQPGSYQIVLTDTNANLKPVIVEKYK